MKNVGNMILDNFIKMMKYFVICSISLIYWEIIMMSQLGAIEASSFFFMFFIPSQAFVLCALCGVGNDISSRILLPVIILLTGSYYIVQIVYMKTFGTLFSISMLGLGNEAIGNFGWAIGDLISHSIIVIILIFIPVIVSIVLACIRKIKIEKYNYAGRIIALFLGAIFWFVGVVGIRAFGTERLSPYYLLTNSSVTSDASARKLGTLTTAVVEIGAYYFGINNESDDFVVENQVLESDNMDGITEDGTPVIIINEDPDYIASLQEEQAEENVIERTPWINDAIDFGIIASLEDNESKRKLSEYFVTREGTSTNEYTGMFEGYNLIYICAESFWNYACNEKVTPTLYKMANNGIVLTNYYNSFYNTTTNGEFAFDTGLWPDVSRHSSAGTDIGSFAQSSTKFMPQGLGDLFSAQGIPSYAFHNYYGKYYRRILSWPNLGYKCKFTGDGMYFTSNWPASDLELMEQSVDDYINDEQFNVYYMTFSGHGPYSSKNYMYNKNINDAKTLMGENYHDEAYGYMAGEIELDKAMEYLINRLDKAGKLDTTVIVLTGDHFPYYLSPEGRDSLAGHKMDDKFEIYHSNCIIYNAGMEQPNIIDNYCCNIDIAPTMLNLFNIPFESRLFIGKDIFSDEAHNRAVLYNNSFVTKDVMYNYDTGEAKWYGDGLELSETDKEKYINAQINSIENEYTASCKLIEENYFLDVYKISGLISDDEISKELDRENKAKSQDEIFNAEDEAKEAERAAKEAEEAAAAAALEATEQLQQMLLQQ